MSQHDGCHEDLLRRALHAAADSVEPSDDGLERIRARLTTPYPLPVAWVMVAYSVVSRWVLGGLESALAWLRSVTGPARERPQPVVWVMAAYAVVSRWVLGGLESALAWLRSVTGPARERRWLARPVTPHDAGGWCR